MIQIRITTKDTVKIKEITELLINNRLVTGVSITETTSVFKDNNGKIKTIPTILLVGRTKASLFNTIEKLLIDKYGDEIPVLYGIPITNIDTKHLNKLKTVVSD
ncbi:MAG TPA: divalent cation tolerance protein CutA [Crocinitomix sp.]|nr:divalent cation tolerance protein CutA [Crocinitomix sp.]